MSGGEAVKQLSVAVAVFCVLLGAIYAAKPEVPAIRRQYPFSGLIRELGDIEENKVSHVSALLIEYLSFLSGARAVDRR